jgi:membrane-bound serine protease (ClpP class)
MEEFITNPFVTGSFLVLGFVFMLLEVFIPSGGILGFLSVGATVFGIFCLFHQGHPVLAIGAIAFFLAAFFVMFKFMLNRVSFTGSLPPDTSTSVDRKIGGLVGKEGVALTPLRPAGMARIDDDKIDVVTLGDFIEKDVPIRVVDISGNRVVVRQIEPIESRRNE